MLQPAELLEVSQRFTGELAAMRTFLFRAGVPVGNPLAIHETATRIEDDRAFHRDLMSHVWVLLDENSTELNSGNLLGIVAIAAAGLQGAAEADEEDAHQLLRFLLAAKHQLERSSAKQANPAVRIAPVEGLKDTADIDAKLLAPQQVRRPEASLANHTSESASVPEGGERELRTVHDRTKYLVGACVVAVAALLLYFSAHWTAPSSNSRGEQTSTNTPATSPRSSMSGSQGAATGDVRKTEPPGTLHSAKRGSSGRAESPGALIERSFPETSANPTPLPSQPVGSGALVAGSNSSAFASSSPLTVNKPMGSTGAVMPSAIAAGKPVRAASGSEIVSADTLSKRLDSPTLPAYAADADTAPGKKYPRLLRRHGTYVESDSAGGSTLSAELRAPNLSAAARSSPAMTMHGSVRSTCVGMMAANLVYGPAPPYPEAAAAARVQGEVKVQATVDRDGTVNAARVISGPPLLREAALDAVQQWRYKPYLSGGKPSPTGTMAVLDFELQ